MNSLLKSSVFVRPDDIAENSITPDAQDAAARQANSKCSSMRMKSSSRKPPVRRRLHPYNAISGPEKSAFVRKASDHEMEASSHEVNKYPAQKDGTSPLKPLIGAGNTACRSDCNGVPRNATFSTIHTSPLKPVKLRRYHTEPFILALRDELKKVTGFHPKTPEKHDNPFEPWDLPGVMSRPWLSPTVFDKQPATSPSFKWSIEHMATLHPVEIGRDDILHTEYLKHVQTESDEDAAQENIRKFFEEKTVHLPSPSSSQVSPTRSPDQVDEEEQDVFTKKRKIGVQVTDVSCQTDVQMAPNFDFEKHFADYQIMMRMKGRTTSSGSSVRRRLFKDMDTSSTNLSWSPEANTSTGFLFTPHSSQQLSSGFGEDFPSDFDMDGSGSQG